MVNLESTELRMLAASAALGIVHLLLAVQFSVATRGLRWGVGPRDEPAPPLGIVAARFERAYKNFLETFPFFVAAVVVCVALERHTAMTALGAQLYFWGRVAYLPLYAAGLPWVRTIAWTGALVGIAMVLAGGALGG